MSSGGIRVLAEAILYRPFKHFSAYVRPGSFEACARLLWTPYLLGAMGVVEPMDLDQYIRSNPSRVRRNALIKARQAREERGCNHKHYYRVNPFGKTEKLPWFCIHNEPTVDGLKYIPRLIQATHDETHLDTGPYFKPALGELKRVWHVDNWIFYGAVGPDVLDEWINKHSGSQSFYCSDLSAFDATWTEPAFLVLESIYRRLFPGIGQWFWKLLREWRRPRSVRKFIREGEFTFWVKYAADYCLASGRDDTALANAILNGLALALSFSAVLAGVKVSDLTTAHLAAAQERCAISIVGDDSLVCCAFDVEPLVPRIEECMRAFGLVAKSQATRELAEVTYLGGMPYRVAGKYYWGPTIGRRFYKAFWQTEARGNLPAWTHGVAKQLEKAQHVPILSDAARQINQLLEGYKSTTIKDEYATWVYEDARPRYDDGTIDWLLLRYSRHGLTRSMIEADLLVISKVVRLPAVLDLPAVRLMTSVDDL